MNILHLDEQRGWRGGEQQASYLIRYAAAQGHGVTLAGRAGSPFLTREHGAADARRIGLPFRGELDVFTARRIAQVVRTEGIDILHAHTSHAHGIACIARAFAGCGKVVVSRRVDFTPKNHALNRFKYRLPDRYIAVSKPVADVLLNFGVPESKIVVVHDGIDPERLEVPALSRAALDVPDDALLLGSVGTLDRQKDHATLIAAMPDVLAAAPKAYLLIAGDGDRRSELENQIRELRLNDRVRLLGYRDDVPNLLRTFDMFVMSSREEGLGTSILDAMSCELPVVATAAGGIPDVVSNETTGLLVPTQTPSALAAAIVRLVEDPSLASRLVKQARRRVLDRFTAARMAEGNFRVYETLLNP
ncbi:MAG: glycosyltransferase [Candidatus Hydrogenedentes bacterium]|nr:glycosyltransferase [Candidatus Hydrogenedentota bacterium]